MSTTNRQSAAQATSQTKNEKGNVIMSTQTNKAVGFVLVNSKEVVLKSTKEKVVIPAQVRMTLEVNGKKQQVAFGHSRLGGRATYVVADGKAPVVMSRADFVKQLNKYGIINMNQVQKELGRIQSIHRDEYIVARCECCGTQLVTAANVDYIQRNHTKLNEKLSIDVTPFSKLCYDCQRGGSKKPVDAPAKKKPVVNPVTVDTNTSVSVDLFTPDVVAEIMALDVDKFSAIAKLQSELQETYYKQAHAAHTLWNQASEASAKAVSHTPIVPAPAKDEDACIVCDRALPAIEDWNSEVCPACSLKGGFEPEYIPTPVDVVVPEAAKKEEPAMAPERMIIELGDECCIICDQEMPDVSVWEYDMCPTCVVGEHIMGEAIPADRVAEARAFIANRASEASPSLTQADQADNEDVAPTDTESRHDALMQAAYDYQEEMPEV